VQIRIVLTWQKDQALETLELQSSMMWPAYVLIFMNFNSLSYYFYSVTLEESCKIICQGYFTSLRFSTLKNLRKKDYKICHYMLRPEVSSWISDLIIFESEWRILLMPWSVWQVTPMKKLRLVVTVLLCTRFLVFLPTWFVVWLITDFYSAMSNQVKFDGWVSFTSVDGTCNTGVFQCKSIIFNNNNA
jgi:hypothetical protein